MIKAITFDFWNTLYKLPGPELAEIRVRGVQKVLLEGGCEFSTEQLLETFRYSWQKAFDRQRYEGVDIGPRGHVDLIIEKLNLNITDKMQEELYQSYSGALLQAPPELNDGVLDTLPRLVPRFKLAVICNTGATPGKTLRKLMQNDGISEFFQCTTFSDETIFSKPDSRIFHGTLEQLQVNSNVAAHIGDDTITDVKGSKLAGMTSVWLAPDADKSIPEADYHVRSVKELLNIF